MPLQDGGTEWDCKECGVDLLFQKHKAGCSQDTPRHSSCQPCGCDDGAGHMCQKHLKEAWADLGAPEPETPACCHFYVDAGEGYRCGREATGWHGKGTYKRPMCEEHLQLHQQRVAKAAAKPAITSHPLFPDSAEGRKAHPVFTGVLMYFPDAIAAVAHVSKLGNDQHNPGQPLHWARGKSMDQTDTATRHMMDHGVGNIKDTDGSYHLAKAAWRILAELQLTIEKERGQ